MKIQYPEMVTREVDAVCAAGGAIAHPPMEIPGHGTFAIHLQGGNHHGLWRS